MTPVYKFSWVLWIGGTLLIVASWVELIPVTIGWIGFGIALAGTLLSMASNKLAQIGRAHV